MRRVLVWFSVLMVVSCGASAQELAQWKAVYKYSEASGNAVCNLRAPRVLMGFMLFRSEDLEVEALVVGGRKDPGSLVHVKIGDQRFSGRENDMMYWAQADVLEALLSSDEIWTEWTAWPGKHREANYLLGDFAEKYEECSSKMQAAR